MTLIENIAVSYAKQIGAWRYPLVNIGCGENQQRDGNPVPEQCHPEEQRDEGCHPAPIWQDEILRAAPSECHPTKAASE